AARLPHLSDRPLVFNWLGRIDRLLPEGARLRPIRAIGHALEVSSFIRDQALTIEWAHSAHLSKEAKELSRAHAAELEALIKEHAQQIGPSFSARELAAFSWTPAILDQILAAVRRAHGVDLANVEDVYPLTPVQEGMLFHALYGADRPVYLTLFRATLRT